MKKFTKEDIAEILKRLLKQENYNDIKSEIEDIADELNIDLTEIEEEEEEPVIEEFDEDNWDSDGDDDRDWSF
jgi:uncharacterized protein YpuA (DUF1002 family)